MILVIDNYDSFVHNVTRYLRELGAEAEVKRNDALTADRISDDVRGIVISPGPCTPHEAGVSLDIVRQLSGHVPILGICLGHQCIGEAFGGKVTRARRPMHGEASAIRHQGSGVLSGLPDGFNAGRYHSLIVELGGGEPLTVTARSEDGEIMGIEHKTHPTYGVQFHPESVLTEHGYDILRNFLKAAG
ncbi:aminodeoxychorismate/anthranilate synthase component II [Nordella sp. HKS 07]|uniref:anthranilate synthase component II n=1 Tax=Nordella sp. HKS 07 TaxID=2712222 RepID=UPI0013E1CEEA|nr:aminodeoxychorismate/anthranilate synthase component II [Nordella sp. HKS 07]QIG47942.1 aminodeoxychorismate/anthranilate synthase component II [Nordella sp. HKS 07]